MVIAVFGKEFSEKSEAYVHELLDVLDSSGAQIWVNQSFKMFLEIEHEASSKLNVYDSLFDIPERPDFIITVGGDGTILDTIVRNTDLNIPVVGFNTGRLGFLANNPKEESASMVEALMSKKYSLDHRSLLSIKDDDGVFENLNYALNEVTVHKKDSASMITIHTYIDNDYVNSYWADGLIVATPTGSTAYSLSCNGPIVVPGSKNFIINPIAPHNLSARPIIVPDDVEIKLVVEGRGEEFLMSLDSRSYSMKNESEIILTKAPFQVDLVKFEGRNFYQTIRRKLMWGRDARN